MPDTPIPTPQTPLWGPVTTADVVQIQHPGYTIDYAWLLGATEPGYFVLAWTEISGGASYAYVGLCRIDPTGPVMTDVAYIGDFVDPYWDDDVKQSNSSSNFGNMGGHLILPVYSNTTYNYDKVAIITSNGGVFSVSVQNVPYYIYSNLPRYTTWSVSDSGTWGVAVPKGGGINQGWTFYNGMLDSVWHWANVPGYSNFVTQTAGIGGIIGASTNVSTQQFTLHYPLNYYTNTPSEPWWGTIEQLRAFQSDVEFNDDYWYGATPSSDNWTTLFTTTGYWTTGGVQGSQLSYLGVLNTSNPVSIVYRELNNIPASTARHVLLEEGPDNGFSPYYFRTSAWDGQMAVWYEGNSLIEPQIMLVSAAYPDSPVLFDSGFAPNSWYVPNRIVASGWNYTVTGGASSGFVYDDPLLWCWGIGTGVTPRYPLRFSQRNDDLGTFQRHSRISSSGVNRDSSPTSNRIWRGGTGSYQ